MAKRKIAPKFKKVKTKMPTAGIKLFKPSRRELGYVKPPMGK